MEAPLGAYVDGDAEQILQVPLKTHNIQQTAVRFPIYEKIQVAAIPECYARSAGAIRRETPRAEAREPAESRLRAILPAFLNAG